ncbi:MAG: Na(+)-translocating NADH-quinone reductase subunit A [Prevotellaceae bacterium]|jgi:Na+-transporting NADH:ubiquinone oxidoreductase subunit A|nr:Na(+)-translocating NADH-quinone reductase subunit A [Prevotellaceae bacterium]
MQQIVKLTKGLDIKLEGLPEKVLPKCPVPQSYALKPTDFHGLTPKMLVREGDRVLAGSPVFCDKYRPEIIFASPVSGTVAAVNRGERRALLEVVVAPDVENEFANFTAPDLSTATRESLVTYMLSSGAWPFLVQRPYGVIANPNATPKAIFISGFDSAPLAADADYLVNGEGAAFQKGVDVLKKLTTGKVHLSLCAEYPANTTFERAKGVEIYRIKGPHPAGNVGVQIHHIAPICKGEVVWTIAPQHVIALGRLFAAGVYDVSKVVALVGSEVKKPRYYRMIAGASLSGMAEFLNETSDEKKQRVISGNVLTGENVGIGGHLGFYHNEVTVIPEGNQYEMLGWIMPRFSKFSLSRTYFSWLSPSKRYRLDTNINGGQRAFTITGQYEKVLPMDIYPVYLLKAILAGEVEKMEQLGIYEVIEEDLALCEFVCTSKIDVQETLRKGIDLMMKEMA